MSHSLAAGEELIRTPDHRLRVFVSSTLGELAEERAVVRAAIERLHLVPVMFELGARPHAPRNLYRAYLAQSHVFVGIYWERYGWVAPGEEVSGLEDEYRLSAGMPQLVYIKHSDHREPRLEQLLDQLRADDRASYRHFRTPEELGDLVQNDLAVLLTERFETAAAQAATTTAPLSMVAPPVPLTATIGRDAEIAELIDLVTVAGARLVTLTGPGGIGKSRLALEVANRIRDRFPDGVQLISLEPVSAASAVVRAIADRLGIVGEGLRPLDELLAGALERRRMLLVFDNFEHVIDAASDVAALLDVCPGVQALVTSRQPLRLRGEREFPLRPLEVPAADDLDVASASGVELFVQRARAVRPDFEVTAQNAAAVGELVRRLDGLPLAIELAAARTRLFTPEQLVTRFAERLDVLSSGAVNLPERQRTLRATIDWSYRLLLPEEQRLLDRLSVFAAGATIDAVQAVCGDPDEVDVLETLSSLLEKSLLVLVSTDAEPHVHLLNTVRVYSAERLVERGEAEVIADRHADWFLRRALLVDPIGDPTAHGRFDVMLHESDDIRAAMDWVLARRDTARTAAFAAAVWMWFWLRGRIDEIQHWVAGAAALADDPGTTPTDRAMLLYCHGQVQEILGDAVTAVAVLEPALAIFRELGHAVGIAACQIGLAAALPRMGRTEESYECSLEALRIGEELGEPHLIGFAAAIAGTNKFVHGDYVTARQMHLRTLAAARTAGIETLEGQAFTQVALVDVGEGDLPSAWRHLEAGHGALRRWRNCEMLSYALETAACALEIEGAAEDALAAVAAAVHIREDLKVVIWPLMRDYEADLIARLRAAVGEGASQVEAGGRARDPWDFMSELISLHVAEDGVGVG